MNVLSPEQDLGANHLHVVSFSGGIGSWMAAKRVASQVGPENVRLLFTDTLIEDADLYRFLVEAAANVLGGCDPAAVKQLAAIASDMPRPSTSGMLMRKVVLDSMRDQAKKVIPGLVWIQEGRTPWEVFTDLRYLGNSRIDPCSRVLKREVADAWLTANCDRAHTTIHVGIDWSEKHRFEGVGSKKGLRRRKAEQGWTYHAPLCEAPFISKDQMFLELDAAGIRRPRLYDLGAAHNNCGGGCIKQGQAGFALLLKKDPAMYRIWMEGEEKLREHLGKNVTILRDRSGGKVTPLPLREFINRVQCDAFDKTEFGGCGCFIDADEDTQETK